MSKTTPYAAQKAELTRLFETGLEAARPTKAVAAALSTMGTGHTLLLAAGKAAAEMTEAALDAGVRPRRGLVVVRRGEGRPLPGLEVLEAAHPEPDGSSVRAGRAMLALARSATREDRALALLSGGASSLLCAPPPALGLRRKRALMGALLRSGASVEELNVVRRHLSRLKGGRLAVALHPATVHTLALSDVVGDAPEAIASGPTAADPSTVDDAQRILARYGLCDPGVGWTESVKPGDPRLATSVWRMVASARDGLAAVAQAARALGFEPVDLGVDLVGEARVVGARHGAAVRRRWPPEQPLAFISGGELTVVVTGQGAGGPNFEYAAALALALEGLGGVAALAGDTDGLDGVSGACGAFVFADTASRARAAGRPLEDALETHDTAPAFAAVDGVYAPGPTGTNVNDFRIILVRPPA